MFIRKLLHDFISVVTHVVTCRPPGYRMTSPLLSCKLSLVGHQVIAWLCPMHVVSCGDALPSPALTAHQALASPRSPVHGPRLQWASVRGPRPFEQLWVRALREAELPGGRRRQDRDALALQAPLPPACRGRGNAAPRELRVAHGSQALQPGLLVWPHVRIPGPFAAGLLRPLAPSLPPGRWARLGSPGPGPRVQSQRKRKKYPNCKASPGSAGTA